MDNEKYYTPTLDEFHQGFEYEWNYKDRGWNKEEYTLGSEMDEMAGDWYEFSPQNPNTQIRRQMFYCQFN